MGVLGRRLQAHEVDHVDHPHGQVGQVLAQQVDGGQRLERGHVAAARQHDVGLAARRHRRGDDAQSQAPSAGPAVVDRRVHVEPVGHLVLAGHHDVHVVDAAQAVVHRRQQRVGVGRQVDAHDLGLLVHDVVDEARVLVREAVVVLAPHVARQQVVERRHRRPPVELAGHLQPLGVLVEHRVDDVGERLVAVEQPVAAGEHVALEPALAQVLGQHLHHPAAAGQVVVAGLDLGHPHPVGHLEHGASGGSTRSRRGP